MRKLASLSSTSSAVRGKLQAALYYGRKKRHPGNFIQVFALTFGTDNALAIAGLRNVHADFISDEAFTLTFDDESVAGYVWDTDHWELDSGVFLTASGIAVLTQGDLTVPIRWTGATIPEEEEE